MNCHPGPRLIGWPAQIRSCVRPLSTIHKSQHRHLTLAYAKHEPPNFKPDPDDPAIVVLHGLFGSKQNNRSLSKLLARDLHKQVYALDLRNHGDSPHDPTHSYLSMAADVTEFTTTHNLRRPILIGHSMGAKVAMTLALQHPPSTSALIPLDNAPVDAVLQSDFGKYVHAMKKIEDAGVTKAADADAILKAYEPSLPIRQFLLTNLVRPSSATPGHGSDGAATAKEATAKGALQFRVPVATLAGALDAMGDFPFTDPEEGRYEGPTLFVRGTKSKYVADEVLPLVGRFFPRFRLRDVEAGHWVVSENLEECRRVIVEFLKGVEEER